MVWAELDEGGTLSMFLSATTGESSHLFAQLYEFVSFQSGTGNLTRSKKLLPQVALALAP
jgi:hypothetical protein